MGVYEAFAGVYDALMDDVDYDGWADYYIRLLSRSGVVPKRLCDCACGTGAMSVRFAERGILVTGVDCSAQMLARAQVRARQAGLQVMFVQQDMCQLRLPRPADALVCACDGVNYLLDDDRLNAFFQAAHAAIRPGGGLAFDISSPYKLETILGNNFFGEERDDIAYLWANHFDAASRTVEMDVTFFAQEPDGRYRRFSEVHTQKAHAPEHLVELLTANGFGDVRVYGDKTFDAPKSDETRIHLAAIRQ